MNAKATGSSPTARQRKRISAHCWHRRKSSLHSPQRGWTPHHEQGGIGANHPCATPKGWMRTMVGFCRPAGHGATWPTPRRCGSAKPSVVDVKDSIKEARRTPSTAIPLPSRDSAPPTEPPPQPPSTAGKSLCAPERSAGSERAGHRGPQLGRTHRARATPVGHVLHGRRTWHPCHGLQKQHEVPRRIHLHLSPTWKANGMA